MREEDWQLAGAGEPAWQPGDLVPGGRYRIGRQLGAWGIRSLYAVTDVLTDHPALLCALACSGGGEVAEHVARLAGLEHPFLPVIREYILRDDLLILLLHVADGTPLDAELRAQPEGRVDERTAVRWGIQVAEGLAFLHRQAPPLVVADLAPSALLLTPYGRLKLVGLGPLLGLFSPAGLVGALEQGYAAPEVYGGRVDPLGDVYAAGALLYQALTGAELGRIAPGALPSVRAARPEVAPELAEIIARAVAREPEARWQSAGEMGEALRQVELALAQREAAEAAEADGAAGRLRLFQVAEPDLDGDVADEPMAGPGAALTQPEPALAPEEERDGAPPDAAKAAPAEAPRPQAAEAPAPAQLAPTAPERAAPSGALLERAPSVRSPSAPAPAAPSPAAPAPARGGGLFGGLGGLFRGNGRLGPTAMRATGTVMLAKRMRPKREYPVLVRILGKPEDEVRAVSFAAGTQIAKTGLGRVKSGTRVTVEVAAVPEDAFRLPQARVTLRAPRPGSVTEARIAVVALRPSPDGADRLQFTFRDEQGRPLHAEPFVADVSIVEAGMAPGTTPSAEMLTLAHTITVLV